MIVKTINLGNIYSANFKTDLINFFKTLSQEEMVLNNKIIFYAYEIHSSGYKWREVSRTHKWELLSLDLNYNKLDIKDLCSKLILNFSDREEFIERDYRRLHNIGEYLDPDNYYTYDSTAFNHREYLEPTIYVDISKLTENTP